MSRHEPPEPAPDLDQGHHEPGRSRGIPGRSTLTSRLAASPASIARAVVAQLRADASEAPSQVQARGGLEGGGIHAAASHGVAGAGGPLPFLDEIQRAFGHHDVGGVRAHVGGRAAEASEAMGALAYAAGDDVAFAQNPDLHLAAHEAAHVVQQRGGVRLAGGVGREGDEYERHADAVADAVVRGESAQALLDPYAHRGSGGGAAVQRHFEAPRNLEGRASEELVALARQLDGQLGEAPEPDRAPMATTLVQIYEILQARVDRGEFQPHGAGDDSPLAGLLDDLAPFGNADMWIALSRRPPRVRRPPRRPAPAGGPGQPRAEAPADAPEAAGAAPGPSGVRSDLGRDDVAPSNVDSSSASDMLTGVSIGLDVIGLIVAEMVLAEAALAIAGPILGMASHLQALEDGVQNHERAGRSLGIRSTFSYCLFTTPSPPTVALGAVRAYYHNSTELQRERNSLTSTGISAGNRIDEAVSDGMSEAATSMNRNRARCEAELRRRLQAEAHREPTADELATLRRQVYQAVIDHAAR